ncbi:MAG: Jag N-terminal domain-containing protein [Chloroflexi bacterium]|nr:Jag N-terminal domain-containing protein [Chloroflexota bacterium]
MPQEKTTLEIIAPTAEEAIANGLNQLGLPEDLVTIEILDAGSKGLLGLGGRQSRVRISVKDEKLAQNGTELPLSVIPPAAEVVDYRKAKPVEVDSLSDIEKQSLKVTRTVVVELLARMRVKAVVEPCFVEPEDDKDERVILVDIQGDDLSILIGRRSETLNALQYISSLIVSKELGAWVPMMIDVQGYRKRRDRQLRLLGQKMADQAIQTGRRQVLEPMPANERRVIHLELREHPQVFTESTGEEPYRKVTISLKN